MKQLTPTNLIAIEVPQKAEDFTWSTEQDLHTIIDGKDVDVYVEKTTGEILGEVTKEGVQFDVEPYIFRSKTGGYRDYTYESKGFDSVGIFNALLQHRLETPQESFQSLLQVNNVEIPEGKKLLILLKG